MARKTQSDTLNAPKQLYILITIINRNKSDFFLSLFDGYNIRLSTVMYARGTAPSQILERLGVTSDDKAVILSLVDEDTKKEVLIYLEDKHFKSRGCKGISFTVPLSSIIGVSLYQHLSNIGEENGF